MRTPSVKNMIKISRGMRARRAGLLNDLLVRAGLRTPPPAGPNIGASVARGLGYGALAAPLAAYGGARAYGLSDAQIGSAIGDTALGLMGGVAEADDRSMSVGAMRDFDQMINGPLYLEDDVPNAPRNVKPEEFVGYNNMSSAPPNQQFSEEGFFSGGRSVAPPNQQFSPVPKYYLDPAGGGLGGLGDRARPIND